jgi:hypothetical protein
MNGTPDTTITTVHARQRLVVNCPKGIDVFVALSGPDKGKPIAYNPYCTTCPAKLYENQTPKDLKVAPNGEIYCYHATYAEPVAENTENINKPNS